MNVQITEDVGIVEVCVNINDGCNETFLLAAETIDEAIEAVSLHLQEESYCINSVRFLPGSLLEPEVPGQLQACIGSTNDGLSRLAARLELEALLTEREAMLAHNSYRFAIGETTHTYGEDAFHDLAERIRKLADELKNTGDLK